MTDRLGSDAQSRSDAALEASRRPLFLTHSLLSEPNVIQLRQASSSARRKELLCDFLDLNQLWPIEDPEHGIHNRRRHEVVLEIFVHTWNFSEKQEMENTKVSTLLALVFDLIKWTCLRDAPQPSIEASYAHFEAELLRHAVQNLPKSIAIFTLPEVRAIAAFVIDFYLRHLNMYQYVLGRTRILQIVPANTTAPGVELRTLPRDDKLFRIQEKVGCVEFPPSVSLPSLLSAIAYVPCEAFGCSESASAASLLHAGKTASSYPESFHFIEEPDTKLTIEDAIARFPVSPASTSTSIASPAVPEGPSNTVSQPIAAIGNQPPRPLSGSSSSTASTEVASVQPSGNVPRITPTVPEKQYTPVIGTITPGMLRPVFAGSAAFIRPTGFASLHIYARGEEAAHDDKVELMTVRPELGLENSRPNPVPLPLPPPIKLGDGTILPGSMPPNERLVRYLEDKIKHIVQAQLNERIPTNATPNVLNSPVSTGASPTAHPRRVGQQTHSVSVR